MKKRVQITIAIIVLIALIWSGGWLFATQMIRTEIEALAGAQAQPQVTCGDLSVTGYPFRFDIYCGDAMLQSGDQTITAKSLKAATRVYSPTHWVGFLEAPVTTEDAFNGSKRELQFTQLQLSARLSWGLELERVSAIGENFVYADTSYSRFELGKANGAELHLLATPDADKGVQLFTRLDNADLVELDFKKANIAIELTAENLDRNVTNWQSIEMLRAWQQADGKLKIDALSVEAEGLAFTAEGEIYLSENGLLQGKVTTQSKGLVERFEPEAYGLMAPTIFGVANADGEYKSLWQFKDGGISLGVAPLLYIPALF